VTRDVTNKENIALTKRNRKLPRSEEPEKIDEEQLQAKINENKEIV